MELRADGVSGEGAAGPGWAVALARVRIPLCFGGLLLLFVASVASLEAWLSWGAVLLMLVGFAGYLRLGTVTAPPSLLRYPVRGRWVAVNSPATRVPSHGLHAYGQTYAVDLVHVPAGEWSPQLGWGGPHTRPPEAYPGFGQPVLAPADGVVVAACSTRSDHGARTSWPGVGLMVLEGFVLELTGRILGNHVVLEVAPSRYVALAHLRRGSVRVAVGDWVSAGDVIGECGNSGNTSEPHVHMQVMDHRRFQLAAGLPMEFTDVVDDDGAPVRMPAGQRAGTSRAS